MNINALTYQINGAIFEVSRRLGAGFLEKVYENSLNELKQHEMRTSGFDDPSLRYFIGDVRDRDRLERAMYSVDIVIHAAALKQVPRL